jgi:hypothetical protein
MALELALGLALVLGRFACPTKKKFFLPFCCLSAFVCYLVFIL